MCPGTFRGVTGGKQITRRCGRMDRRPLWGRTQEVLPFLWYKRGTCRVLCYALLLALPKAYQFESKACSKHKQTPLCKGMLLVWGALLIIWHIPNVTLSRWVPRCVSHFLRTLFYLKYVKMWHMWCSMLKSSAETEQHCKVLRVMRPWFVYSCHFY